MKKYSPSSPLHILLVEDNEHDRLSFRRAFRKIPIPIEITECIRAESALEYLPNEILSFDLIVTDYNLPGMTGLDFCRELLRQNVSIPLVMLTGTGSESIAVEAIKSGVSDYLIKDPMGGYLKLLPVILPEVVQQYHDRLARKRAEKELRIKDSAIASSINAIAITDLNGMLTYVNPAFLDLWGYDNETEVLDKSIVRFWHKEENVFQTLDILRQKGGWIGESVAKKKNGKVFDVQISGSIVTDETGNPVCMMGSFVDITERKQMEIELKNAKESAEAANQAKSRFLANMSHEIRTPMNAIMGLTDITLKSELSHEQQENLMAIRDSAYHLLGIIDNILDLSKIEAGKIELESVDFDLYFILRGIIRIFSIQVQKKGLYLKLDISDDVPQYIKGDPIRLRQILINLVSNGIRFTQQGGIQLKVEICDLKLETGNSDVEICDLKLETGNSDVETGNLESEATRQRISNFKFQISNHKSQISNHKFQISNHKFPLIFSVSDTGIGIPKDKQDKIFDNFTQAENFTTRKYGGTGLGLAICKKLVELMDGLICVESELGEGSSFLFSIPFALGDKKNIQKKEKEEPNDQKQIKRSLKILLAEDNPINAMVAEKFLTQLGHTIVIAIDGEQAIRFLSKEYFDLIFMDVEMPNMDGTEATRRIRAGEAGQINRKIPIIAMTAHALTEFKEKCENVGMNDFVTKPVNFYELNTIIARNISDTLLSAEKPPENHTVTEIEKVLLNKEEALQRFGGNKTLLRKTYSFFVKGTPPMLEELRYAIDNNNMKTAGLQAHSIKSTCKTISAESCSDIAAQLEQSLKENRSEKVRLLFNQLEQELNKVMELIYNL